MSSLVGLYVWLRHEVAFVLLHGSLADATRRSAAGILPERAWGVIPGCDSFRKNVSLPVMGSPQAVRGAGDCQHRGGREPGSDRMLKETEPLINVVIQNEPKMLTGSAQKGRWPGKGAPYSPFAERTATGEQAGAKRSIRTNAEHGKPEAFPGSWGRKVVRPTVALRVKEAGKSECRAVMAGIRGATCPGAKASRLPAGVSSRELLINRQRRQSR